MKLTHGKMDGYDIAVYQKNLNIPKVKSDFVFVKATQGSWYTSPTFVSQYKAATDAGRLVGIYHYNEGTNVDKEVSYFLEAVGDRLGKAVLALDEEGVSNSLFNTSKMVQNVTEFMTKVYERTGIKMVLYMSKSVFQKWDWSDLKKGGYKIWVAQYASNNRTGYQEAPWTDDNGFGAFEVSDLVFLQYTSNGLLENYEGRLDLDKAFISASEWASLAGGETSADDVETASEGNTEMNSDTLYIKIDPQAAIINLALAEVGYQEKKSASGLDRKHINAGNANYTKYAEQMHKIYPATMDANPIPWCDAFCDWLFYKCFGVSTAKSLLGQFDDYTVASANQFIKMGGWVTRDFEPGDQIFFSSNDKVSGIYHTGIFWKYENNRTYVIEGNTSGSNYGSVIADGGSVCIRSYPRVPNRIVGAGRPKWSLAGEILVVCPVMRDLAIGANNACVKALQAIVGATTDGSYGSATKASVSAFQKANGLNETGVCDKDTWPVVLSKLMISTGFPELEIGSRGKAVKFMQAVIGATPDGNFGNMTHVSLKKWQSCHNLASDGVCGPKTWATIMREFE